MGAAQLRAAFLAAWLIIPPAAPSSNPISAAFLGSGAHSPHLGNLLCSAPLSVARQRGFPQGTSRFRLRMQPKCTVQLAGEPGGVEILQIPEFDAWMRVQVSSAGLKARPEDPIPAGMMACRTCSSGILPSLSSAFLFQGIKAPCLAHAIIPQPDGNTRRGVVALEDVAAGDTLVMLPRDSALCLLDGEPCPSGERWLEPFWADHPDWYVRLGIKLLLEREKGSSSRFAGYMALLPPQAPDTLDFPVEWSPTRLADLRYTPLERSVARQQRRWTEMASALEAGGGRFGEADLRWAFKVCLSRAFAGSFGGGALSLVPGIGLLTEIAAAMRNGRDYALLPMIDSCNHRGAPAPSSIEFSPLTGRLELRAAGGGARGGAESMISYGPLGNDALLQRFGFVEADCAHDTVAVLAEDMAQALALPPGELHARFARAGLRSGPDAAVVVARGGEPASERDWTALEAAVGPSGAGRAEGGAVLGAVAARMLERSLAGAAGGGSAEGIAAQFRAEKQRLLREVVARWDDSA